MKYTGGEGLYGFWLVGGQEFPRIGRQCLPINHLDHLQIKHLLIQSILLILNQQIIIPHHRLRINPHPRLFHLKLRSLPIITTNLSLRTIQWMLLPILPSIKIVMFVLDSVGCSEYVLQVGVEAKFAQLLLGLEHLSKMEVKSK